jgi:hypothetical protein
LRAKIADVEIEGTAQEIGEIVGPYLGRNGGKASLTPTSQDGFVCQKDGRKFPTKQGLAVHTGLAHGGHSQDQLPEPQPREMLVEVNTGVPEKIAEDLAARFRAFNFVCMVGPTETKHEVAGPTPNAAIEAHDKAYPNHRFVTAHESSRRPKEMLVLAR